MSDNPIFIEAARQRNGMVTTPQACADVMRGQAEAEKQAAAMQAAYHTWTETESGAAAERMARSIVTHVVFDEGWRAGYEWARHNALVKRANHNDRTFAQLCADDAEALQAHEDDMYFTRYGL